MNLLFGFLVILLLLVPYSLWQVRRDYKKSGGLSYSAVLAVWAAYLLHTFLVAFAAWYSFWLLPLDRSTSVALGLALLLLGLGFSIAGISAFRSFKRMSGLQRDRLVKTGVYQWSRNPQNVGWLLALLGVAIWGRSGIALLLVGLFGLILHFYIVKIEEEYLERTFGEDYRQYCSVTSCYFGPPKDKQGEFVCR